MSLELLCGTIGALGCLGLGIGAVQCCKHRIVPESQQSTHIHILPSPPPKTIIVVAHPDNFVSIAKME